MDKLSELLTQLLNFRLWIDGIEHMDYAEKCECKKKVFNDVTFKGGVQKILLLAVLLFACSFTFWTAKNVSPDDIEKIFSKSFITTIVSGFSVYFLFNLIGHAVTKNINSTRYNANILILHLGLSLSSMLLGNVTGLGMKFDDFVFKVSGSAKFSVFAWCFCCTVPIALVTFYNTRDSLGKPDAKYPRVILSFFGFVGATTILLYAYLNSQILSS
jgi:hypothetical protein